MEFFFNAHSFFFLKKSKQNSRFCHSLSAFAHHSPTFLSNIINATMEKEYDIRHVTGKLPGKDFEEEMYYYAVRLKNLRGKKPEHTNSMCD